MRVISTATQKRIPVGAALHVAQYRLTPIFTGALASLQAYDDATDACKEPFVELPPKIIEPPPLKRPRQNEDDNMFL